MPEMWKYNDTNTNTRRQNGNIHMQEMRTKNYSETTMNTPPILKRLIGQLERQGYKRNDAIAIAVSKLQHNGNLYKHTIIPTVKGIIRGQMTPAERAKDRAAKKSGHKPSEYKYNNKTNSVRLK